MYDTSYQAGATSKIVKIRAITISTGLPCTTLTNASSGLAVHYCRDGATQQTITQVSATSGTYTSSGFVHQGDGVYEIGAPTASLAAGADGVLFSASGVTDVFFTTTRVDLTGTDPRSSAVPDVNVTTIAGQTASAAAGVTFPSSIASPTNITAASGVALTSAYDPAKTAAQAGDAMTLTSGERTTLAASIWNALTSGLTTVGSIGKWIVDKLDVVVSTRLATSGYTAPLDAAGTRSAVGLASANLDTQLDALPTNAELATALGTADDAVLAAIAGLNNLSAAQVNAEVVDALATDTYAEPASVPAATATLKDKIGWLALLARNKITQTATTQTVFADDGSTTVGTSTVSDDNTTATRGEFS